MIKEFKTQTHEEWLELRGKYIGGSDAAAVVGMNPFKSAYALWAEKTGKSEPFTGNLATEVGTFLEEFVAKKFEEETGKKVRRNNRSLVNDKYPFAIANIDREVVGEDAGLEIKTTSELNTKSFKNGEYPANYYCQCMHYMAVTGKSKWYLAVLIGNRDFRIFEIERDDDEIAALMNAEANFWAGVQSNTPPAPDGSQSSADAITTIYPESNDDEVNLSAYETDLRLYIDLGHKVKELKTQQDEIGNRIKAFMGEAGRGIAEGFKVSFSSSSRSSFDSKKFAADHADMDLSDYYNTTNTRTFRVTERK